MLWLVPKAASFDKKYRFVLGDRLVTRSLEVVELLAGAAYAPAGPARNRLLESASQRLNGMRYLLRACRDLQLLSADSYGHAAGLIEEVGRMIGGWRKSQRSEGGSGE